MDGYDENESDYLKDEESRYPDLTFPDGWTKAHDPIFKTIVRECRSSDLFADRYLKFAQGDHNHILLILEPPLKGRWTKDDARRPFVSIQVAGPESLYVYDAGIVDISSSYACKHKGPLERPAFNYDKWEDLKEDPFAVCESPVMVGILLKASDPPDLIASELTKFARLVFRVMCSCRAARRLKKKKRKEAEADTAAAEADESGPE